MITDKGPAAPSGTQGAAYVRQSSVHQVADSDEVARAFRDDVARAFRDDVARAFRDDVARRSDMMSPGSGALAGG